MCCLKDTHLDQSTTTPVAAASICVFQKYRSGTHTWKDIRVTLHDWLEWSIICSIPDQAAITSFPKETMVDPLCRTIQLRVQCATCTVVQRCSWFPPEHNVQMAGASNTPDIWCPTGTPINAVVSSVWMGRQKLPLVQEIKTKPCFILLKWSAVYCHVRCTSAEEN